MVLLQKMQFVIRLYRRIFKIYKIDIDKANSKKIYSQVRKKDCDYITILKKNGIIAKDANMSEFGDSMYSRLITVALIYQLIDKK